MDGRHSTHVVNKAGGTGPASDQGWQAVAAELTGAGEHAGLWTAAKILLRSPIRGASALAEDPAFISHFKFFSLCLAAWLGYFLVAAPRFASWYSGDDVNPGDATYASVAFTILEYLEVCVLLIAGYFIYRLGSKTPRRPMSYFKFTLMGAGLMMLLSIALQSLRIAGIVFLRATLSEDTALAIVQSETNILLVNAAILLAQIALLAALNRVYWDLRWRFVVPATLALAAINVAVVIGGIWLLDQSAVKTFIANFI